MLKKIVTSSIIVSTLLMGGIYTYSSTNQVELREDLPIQRSNIDYKSNYIIENNPYNEKPIYVETTEPKIEMTTSSQQKPSPIKQKQVTRKQQKQVETIVRAAEELIGTPYVWGGTTPYKGMDCSGYTQYVMKQAGIKIPRVSKGQSKVGKLVPRDKLRVGDLLFFDTTNPRDASDIKTPTQEMQYAQQAANGYKPLTVSHVGIYMGNGIMLHASSGDGIITYADLNSNYYKNRFLHARRVIK